MIFKFRFPPSQMTNLQGDRVYESTNCYFFNLTSPNT